ncbi:ATP synthase F1 subunit epsilon [bacterium]|nr:ATP synthase F1 subunit epsilon [bacterium]
MINVKVILPSGIKIDQECDSCIIPGVDGDFAVLEGHTAFITKIRPGLVTIDVKKQSTDYAIHDGFVTVEDNKVTIVSERIEKADEIDKNRAEQAMKRAKERLAQTNNSEIDFRRAESALKRAITRIRTSN